jgi:hypothetical protein
MKDFTALTVDVDRARVVVDRVQAILERACKARTLDQAIDRIYNARNELADVTPRLAAILREPPPFVPPDPVMAELWAAREPSGHLQD